MSDDGSDHRPIALFDVAGQEAPLREELLDAVGEVARSGRYVLGAPVERFEDELAGELSAAYSVGVSSGSDALVCALSALGIGPGDEVITAAFGFFATAEAILRVGATPCLVDVLAGAAHLDARAARAAIGSRTRAVLVAHLYGHAAPVDELRELTDRHGLALVEDAAQAFGASLHGKALGTWGHAGCLSFFPTKPLGAWGDAGAVVTSDPALAERVRRLRQHGSPDRRVHVERGGNFRLDALQAAVLSVKLRHAEAWRRARAEHAARYAERLGGIAALGLPAPSEGEVPCWSLYTVRVRGGLRDAVAGRLHACGIETGVYYPVPLHLQPALGSLGLRAGDFPAAERAAAEVLSLPCRATSSADEVGRVVAATAAAI